MSVADDPQSARAVQVADVRKQGRLAARLDRTPDGVRFAYDGGYAASDGSAVASTLPVGAPPVVRPAGALPAFFEGLLPEGRRLGALRRAVKTSADDELSLLLAVGSDTVGDVQVVPAGELPAPTARVVLDDARSQRFADLAADLGIRIDRTALPGVQDKASAAMINLPVARSGERWILKLDPPEFPHLVEDEAFFLRAARLSGLDAAHGEVVHDADGRPGLLVRRFDRVTVDGQPRALAVEDACQALGRPPADKYVVGAEAALGALARLCGAPLVAARTLLAQLVFAYLTGNGDAHGKNFSVLQGLDGEWRAAPAYDVPSSQPYGDTTMALSIGGRVSGDFGGRDFLGLGAALDLPERAVRRLLAEQGERVDRWLPDLDQLPYDAGKVRKLRRVIDHRRRRLAQL